MSPNQKRFKIVSLIILLAALVQVVGGVLLLLGSPLAAAWRVGLGEGLVGGDAVASAVLGVRLAALAVLGLVFAARARAEAVDR